MAGSTNSGKKFVPTPVPFQGFRENRPQLEEPMSDTISTKFVSEIIAKANN